MLLERRWRAFCRRAGAKPGMDAGAKPGMDAGAAGRVREAFTELDRRYCEPGRHYHGWAHVAFCLRELRRARPVAEPAMELAMWFHDAVYVPGRADNEQASAEMALHWAAALGLAPELGQRAAGLILATRHESSAVPHPDPSEALLQDIDLAVLGACRDRYRRYERGIAREYAGRPAAAFREGRARLLRSFLARPVLYLTPSYRRLERRARANLARALARLERD
jgi:predicted metal-dependent HD superfamily phosphohydrolase